MATSTGETNKAIVIKKRRAVKALKAKGFTKTQVQKKLAVTPHFVRKWWNTVDIKTDRRGWPKGKFRTYTQEYVDNVLYLRDKLIEGKALFYGPNTILERYQEEFPRLASPSRTFVIGTLKKHGRAKPYRKRVKNGSLYQHYPVQSILTLGKIVEEVDFTGRKNLKGYPEPIHFFARVYRKPFKLPLITRILSPSGQEAAETLVSDWKFYPLPNVLKLDNDTTFCPAGWFSDSWLSRFTCWLLNLGITPVFSAFSKP